MAAPPAPARVCSRLTGEAWGSVPQPASSPLAKSYSRTWKCNFSSLFGFVCGTHAGTLVHGVGEKTRRVDTGTSAIHAQSISKGAQPHLARVHAHRQQLAAVNKRRALEHRQVLIAQAPHHPARKEKSKHLLARVQRSAATVQDRSTAALP